MAQLYNPARLDQPLMERLFSEYAAPAYRGRMPYPTEFRSDLLWGREEKPEDIDPRIFSRMSDRALCEEITLIEAGDYRRLNLQQRYPVGGARRRFQG